MTIERYKEILIAAIEIQQLKKEINKRLAIIADNITASELKSYDFDKQIAEKAMSIIKDRKDIVIESANHVLSVLKYKNLEINLHELPSKLSNKSMKKILEGIKQTDIYNA